MNKIKTLKIVILALVLMNVIFLGFYFFRRPPRHPSHLKEMIVHDLGFDKEQEKKYDDLIDMHRQNMERLEKEKRNLKKDLYQLLDGTDNLDKGQPQMISQLGALQVEMEVLHYEHFNRIRKLCKGNQLKKFNALKKKIVDVFSNQPPKKRR